MTEARRGLLQGFAAYVLWGAVPVYWKLMIGISPIEILAHRVVWGMVALVTVVRLAGAGPEVLAAVSDRRTLGMMALSGTLLVINWGTFIGAVAAGRLLDASLGYFINPLISVGLGTLVLHERLRRLQWIAIGLAIAGVVILSWRVGHVPWISLVLACSFGSYGLVRKLARVESLAGSMLETTLLAPIAAVYLVVLAVRGGGGLGHAGLGMQLLLLSTGAVTAGPLLLFTSAARRLPLSTIGFLQYLTPIGQLVLAVAVYGEAFARDQLMTFGLIWLGLAVFTIDVVRRQAGQPNRPVM
ncbi:MAG TPA: EamA family transporter RarD [Kofleriaceae bacterium]|nr:EamA family transporter RarD [Kofleriaceae bacterium]